MEDDAQDWRGIHDVLLRLAGEAARIDFEVGQALIRAERARVHEKMGYGSLIEYADRLLGFAPHTTRERLRIAKALEELPRTTAALQCGDVTLSAVRELTRVATPETEKAWLEAASDQRVRDIEQLVRGRQPGDTPDDPRDPELERHVLRLELTPATYALFREAVGALQRNAGESLDTNAQVELMARAVLEGSEEGRANYQIAMTTCDSCGRTWQQGCGEQVLVDEVACEKAACDAQYVGHLEPTESGEAPTATQSVPPAVRRLVMRRHGGCCAVPGCRHAMFVDLHHVELRSEGGDHNPNKLIALCSAHHDAAHEGRLLIDGDAVSGFVFRHADGRPYGARLSVDAADTFAKAYSALMHLGFKSKHVRPALEDVRSHVGPTATLEAVIRAALELLTPARVRAPVMRVADCVHLRPRYIALAA